MYFYCYVMYSYYYVYVFLLLYMFPSGYSVSLCCSVYCLFVTVYCNCTVLYSTALHCTVLYCTVLYLYCTVLYSTALYCTVLYCTVLLPPGVNPIAVKKYIISYIISYHIILISLPIRLDKKILSGPHKTKINVSEGKS